MTLLDPEIDRIITAGERRLEMIERRKRMDRRIVTGHIGLTLVDHFKMDSADAARDAAERVMAELDKAGWRFIRIDD